MRNVCRSHVFFAVTFTFAALFLLAAPLIALPAEHGVMIRPARVYLNPEASGAPLLVLAKGNEISIFDKVSGFAHVLATVAVRDRTVQDDQPQTRDVDGWIVDNGYVTAKTEHGDEILFGEAAESEIEASTPGGSKNAVADAQHLYFRVFDFFPHSPLAGEALYRSADILWQIDKADMMSRPSHLRAPDERLPIDEEHMRQVSHKFPHTKWDDLAEYRILDNKLCGDWQAESKCPRMEAEVYLKYADKHPASPMLAEALYNAAYRFAALIDIYQIEDKASKSAEARGRAMETAKRLLILNASADWNARAERLLYRIHTGVPVYSQTVQ